MEKKEGANKGLQKGLKEPRVSTEAIEVLRALSVWNYQPSLIAKRLKKSRVIVYKHINNLISKGFYDKIKGLTRGAYTLLGGYSRGKGFRIHKVQVYFYLPLGVDKLKWRRFVGRVLTGKRIEFEALPVLKNKAGVTDRPKRFWLFDKFDARVHANGVMVYFPEIFGVNRLDAELKLIVLIGKFGRELNRIFGVNFFDEFKLNVRILTYELAHLNDSVAKEFRREGKKLTVSIDGVRRVIIDFSHKIDEFEAVSVGYGLEDQETAQHFFKSIFREGKNVLTPSDAMRLFDSQAKINYRLRIELKELNKFISEQNKLNFFLNESLKGIRDFNVELLDKLKKRGF